MLKLRNLACRTRDPKRPIAYLNDNGTVVHRPYVPDDLADWSKPHPDYKPVEHTSSIVLANPVWADPVVPNSNTKWNCLDNNIDRRSHMGIYELVDNLPRNPVGRTGIIGRGLLGRWGPNHAADPITTRFKKDESGNINIDPSTKKPILQFVAIQRKDTKQWAIPGGMVDPGEKVSVTLKREFMEEALNSEELSEAKRNELHEKLKELFDNGVEVYRGYVDDPRNTDQAWMETVAYNFHDESGIFNNIKLTAGDDAKHVRWTDISSNLNLYANHRDFILKVVELRKAHW